MFNAFSATESGANQIHAYMPTGAENGDTDVIQFGDFVVSYVSREVSSICVVLVLGHNCDTSNSRRGGRGFQFHLSRYSNTSLTDYSSYIMLSVVLSRAVTPTTSHNC